MLLQTNSYIVPRDKRAEHARLLRRFRQVLHRLGCEDFEVYEQVGANWASAGGEATGRVVQIMRFRDRRHQLAVQAAERNDPVAQAVIAEFCELINFPYQQQRGLFAVGFYNAVLPATGLHRPEAGAAGVHPDAHPEAPAAVEHGPDEAGETHEAAEAPPQDEMPLDARPAHHPSPFSSGAAGVVAAGAAAAEALVEEPEAEPVVERDDTPAPGETSAPGETAAPAAGETPALAGPIDVSSEPSLPGDERPGGTLAEATEPSAEAPRPDEGPVAEDNDELTDDGGPGGDQPAAPEATGADDDDEPAPEEPLAAQDLDLDALLDPHLDHDDRPQPPPLPHASGHDNSAAPHPGHQPEADLSLDGLLDDDGAAAEPEGRQNVAHGAGRG